MPLTTKPNPDFKPSEKEGPENPKVVSHFEPPAGYRKATPEERDKLNAHAKRVAIAVQKAGELRAQALKVAEELSTAEIFAETCAQIMKAECPPAIFDNGWYVKE